jgi:hypothetical protein
MRRLLILLAYLYNCISHVSAQNLELLQQQYQHASTVQDKLYTLDALANYFTWTEGGYDKAKFYGQQMISLAQKSNRKELFTLSYLLS